ncbi:RmlC-like cupin, partial [Delitschia confertaspora ATCC 74209]
TAPTTLKRFQRLLTAAGQKLLSAEELKKLVVFDFNGAKPGDLPAKFAGIETFPILTDLGISSALASLEPCSMSPPHFHPRATEFFTVIEGSADFFYILENGLVTAGQDDVITGHLDKFQATVFPRTSVHYQINPTCEKSVFIATFSSEDPGTQVV